jgi:putative GTP pyrophosphokinase
MASGAFIGFRWVPRNSNTKGRKQIMPETDQVRKSEPETIRQFQKQEPNYQKLCTEVAHILEKRLQTDGIKISAISSRAKTLESFLEKISRKEYEKPFEDITDFAGVRVVFLYGKDVLEIERSIQEEFEVVGKTDKNNENGTDKFGYAATHFIIRLGDNVSGARYDDLKKLTCEIQVRTVLQDAWAIIEHHLGYKSKVPSVLKRKLNGLAGLLEVADDQFEQIRNAREAYNIEIENSEDDPQKFLENELNLDSFLKYLQWKYRDEVVDAELTSFVFDFIATREYKTLAALDSEVSRGHEKIAQISDEDKGTFEHYLNGPEFRSMTAILLVDPKSRRSMSFSKSIFNMLKKYGS